MLRFLVLFFSLSIYYSANAQEYHCGTPPLTNKQRTYIQDQIRTVPIAENTGTTCIPIKIHIFHNSDGSGGVTTQQLANGLTYLNSFYLDAGIEFFYCDGFNSVNNSDLYNYNAQAPDNDTEAMLVAASGQATNAVNIYFVSSIVTSTGFHAAGYAYYPHNSANANRILMTAGSMSNPNGTFVHEFGHYFSLPHTHEGTEDGPNSTHAESVARTGTNANCGTEGDGFCDTHADPKDGVNVTNCAYTGDLQDKHNVTYTPPIDNIMSYYSDACGGIFTPNQYTAIAQGLQTRQGHTAYDYSYTPAAIPVPTDLTASFSGVSNNLDWTDVANGSTNDLGYIIERSTTSANTGFSPIIKGATDQDGTFFNDSDIAPNTTYWYRVKPTNGNCNTYSNVTTIATGPVITCTAASLYCSSTYISQVQFGAINQSSGCDNYRNYTNLIATVKRNNTYSITVTNGNPNWWDDISIWVDWNNDHNFNDTDESQVCIINNGGTGTYNIVVPANAPIGKTLMRVKIETSESNGCNPCTIDEWGEIEDYTIEVLAPLPIKLNHFSGQQKGINNLLSWTTESEEQSDFFSLERSIDGKIFSSISRIKTNNTPSAYQYTDSNPFSGTNYYRLKMVDFDGRFDYSEVITISNKRAFETMMLFPNPANNEITIALSTKIPNKLAQVSFYDVSGKLILNKTTEIEQSIQIDISHLPKGIYTTKVATDANVFISRFSKL